MYHISGRKRYCKHIVAVQMLIMCNETAKQDKQVEMAISDPGTVCPHCREKTKCHFRGKRNNKHCKPPRV